MDLKALENIKQSIVLARKLGFVPIVLDGKKPVLNSWTKIQKENAVEKISEGFANHPKANNIGVICGEVSGIVVVDIDVKNDGLSTWNDLIRLHGDPSTLKVLTGSGGYHYYFRYNSDNMMLKSRSGAVKFSGTKVGIDIKSNGGQVVFVGSIHPETKRLYELVKNETGSMPPIGIMPEWLLTRLLETESSNTNKSNNDNNNTNKETNNNNNTKDHNTNNNNLDQEKPPLISEETLTELLDNLHSDRNSNYDDWIKVVWAIKSVSPTYYHIARKFSQCTKRDNFDEKVLQKVWSDGKDCIGLGSLLYWLKCDTLATKDVYADFVEKHKLILWQPEPVPFAGGKSINSHGDRVTWHDVIRRYHTMSVWDVDTVVKDIVQCVALIVGADELYFVKEKFNEEGVLKYGLTKSQKFETIAAKYYFMECRKARDGTIERIPWTFKGILITYLSKCTYNSIEFSPAGTTPGSINLFTGLHARRVTGYQVEDIAPTLKHIREVLCNDDDACYEYFLNKLAYFFQFLGIRKVGVADMIISAQGIGKNIFYEHLGRYILGDQHWYITSDIKKLTGRFNKSLEGKLMIVGDEAKGHGKTAELIKPLITQENQWVEPKGTEQYRISDWAMYVFFANSARYFEVETGDRRYLVLHGSDRYKGNKEYFDNFSAKFQQYKNEFYSFLMDRDISGFNVQDIPSTSMKLQLQEAAGTSCQVFIKTWDWIHLKENPNDNHTYFQTKQVAVGEKISLADLYIQYVIWCKQNGQTKIDSKIQFGKDLAGMLEIDSNKMKWLTHKA